MRVASDVRCMAGDGQKLNLSLGKGELRPTGLVPPDLPAQAAPKTGSPRVYCGPFVLIGAMNPCPYGYYGDPVQERTCSNAMVSR
jgi:hypothetical protein